MTKRLPKAEELAALLGRLSGPLTDEMNDGWAARCRSSDCDHEDHGKVTR